MDLTFEAVKSIISEGTGAQRSEQELRDSLRRAALTLAGAINYIHPKENGNGRSGRILHYLIEFGTERGEMLFEDEMYSLIAKIETYEGDDYKPLFNTPPPEVYRALGNQLNNSESQLVRADRATRIVESFLKMMSGDEVVLIRDDVVRWRKKDRILFTQNSIDAFSLYLFDYTLLSEVPNRDCTAVDPGVTRIQATPRKRSGILIDFDIIWEPD
jgi:hypothetical protein